MPDAVVLRLYLAGEGPNSTAARANLERLLGGVDRSGYSLEVVDCLRDPLRVLSEGVLVTPTLVRVLPEPAVTIIGTLGDARGVMDMLGLPASRPTPAEPAAPEAPGMRHGSR